MIVNLLLVVFSAIIGFDLAVALFATNTIAIGICKYLDIVVSVSLLIIACSRLRKK